MFHDLSVRSNSHNGKSYHSSYHIFLQLWAGGKISWQNTVAGFSNSLGVSDVFCLKFVFTRPDSSKIFWRRPRWNIGDSSCLYIFVTFARSFGFKKLKNTSDVSLSVSLGFGASQNVKMSLHLSLCFRGFVYLK